MKNVVYGHFDSAGSLHKQIASFCRDPEGFHDDARLIRLYAGAIAECLLDYEDWKEGIDTHFGFSRTIGEAIDTTKWHQEGYSISAFVLDRDTEIGRSLVRTYLDDTPETSYVMLRNIRSSLRSLIPNDNEFWTRLYDMVMVTLVSEQVVHTLCDQVIDICIGAERWSLGDTVQAFATLAGKYHAKVIEVHDLGASKPAVIEHDFDYMVKTMMGEAVRLGMSDNGGIYTMMAANDTQPYIPYHKAESVDFIAEPLFKIFKVMDSDLRSMMVAKSTGRMMAVAAAGDSPDMDSCVVTPLVLSCVQGSYISSLNS